MANTIDLRARRWGRNYNVLNLKDGGMHAKLAVWVTPTPSKGDFLILALADDPNGTRYKVDAIKYCGDPGDMSVADCTFAPRPGNERTS